MRHRKANVKLGRTATHRDAMLRNIVTSLFEYEKVTTTLHKAKALRPLVDRLVGLAKNGKASLHAFRQAAEVLTKKDVLKKMFDVAPGRFDDRNSGYTTMVKIGPRKGDAAPLVIVELVQAGQPKSQVGAASKPKTRSGDRSKRVAQSRKLVQPSSAAEPAPVASTPVLPELEPVQELEAEEKK